MSEFEMDVFAVVNGKGGVGKTMLTRALGSAVVGGGLKVGLIDADPQQSMRAWADRSIAAGLWSDAASVYSAERAGDMIDAINGIYERQEADIVIVDTAGVSFAELGSVIAASDRIIIPCTPNFDDVSRTLETAAVVRGVGEGDSPIAFVVNKVGKSLSVNEAAEIERLRAVYEPLSVYVRDRDAYRAMSKVGLLSSMVRVKCEEGSIKSLSEARRLREALLESVDLLNAIMECS